MTENRLRVLGQRLFGRREPPGAYTRLDRLGRGEVVSATLLTDGKQFVCIMPEIGLAGEGASASEAYENLVSTWERNRDLLTGGLTDRVSLSDTVRQERQWRWWRNGLITVAVVLGGLVAVDAVVSSVARLPGRAVRALVASRHTLLPRVADRLQNMDAENRRELVRDLNRIYVFMKDLYQDVTREADGSSESERGTLPKGK